MAQWNQVIPKWAESKLIVPLDSLMSPREWADFQTNTYPIARRIGIYQGRLYGVTTGLNIWACYYRTDDLLAAGLDPNQFPKSLEGLVDWGRQLKRVDKRGNLTRLGFLPQWYCQYAPAFGDGFWDWPNPQRGLLLDTPDNLRALSYLVECRTELGFENVLRFESGLRQGFATEWPFISGQYAITVDGQWRVQQLAQYAPELRYGTAAIPPPAGGRQHAGWSNGNFMIIPTGAKCPKGAWEFIKFWSGLDKPERAAEFYTWGGWLPLSKAIADAPIYREYVRKHPQFQTFLDVLPSENVQPTPPVPFQDYLWDRVTQADDSAMRGTVTPKQALERLAHEVEIEQAKRKELRLGQ
jgi:multiple sugar transport system substrate-binding protein